MLLYLRLLTDTLRRTGTRRRDLLWENLVLRQQLAVYQRTDTPAAAAAARLALLVPPGRALGGLAQCDRLRATRNDHPLAPRWLAALLDLAQSRTALGTPADQSGDPEVNPAGGAGESPLGCAPSRR